VELNDSIRPQKVTIYRGGTPMGGRRLGRNPRRWRPCCLGRQEAWPMGWTYLTQEEAQRTIEPNTLTETLVPAMELTLLQTLCKQELHAPGCPFF
jgi:hypothetical protein